MTDSELLERLGASLAPAGAPAEPSPIALQDLHRAVDAVRSGGAVAARRRPSVLTIAVAASMVAACTAVALVATSLPRIGRDTAIRITVPALGAVTERQRALEIALARGVAPAVATAAARLRVAVDDLTASEWAPIKDEIEDLLARADALLIRSRGGNDDGPGLSPSMVSTTTGGVAPVGTQPTTSAPTPSTSPAAPPPPAAATGATSPSVTVSDDDDSGDDDDAADDDSSGPGSGDDGGAEDDDSSGPGGGGGSGSGSEGG
jgi:hypothetical protein